MSNNHPKNYYEILPKKYVPAQTIRYKNHCNTLIDLPFSMCIVGPKGAFKTNTFANIRDAIGAWTKVYLFCPNIKQPIYQHMIDSLEKLGDKQKNDFIMYGTTIDEIPDIDTFEKEHNNLLIIDDMTTENLELLNSLITNGRHHNISIIIIVHSYFVLPSTMRKSMDYTLLKDIRSKTDLRRILSEFNHEIPIEEVVKKYNQATHVNTENDKLNWFMIDSKTHYPVLKYRKNYSPI